MCGVGGVVFRSVVGGCVVVGYDISSGLYCGGEEGRRGRKPGWCCESEEGYIPGEAWDVSRIISVGNEGGVLCGGIGPLYVSSGGYQTASSGLGRAYLHGIHR